MPASAFSVEALLRDRAWVRALALSLVGDPHRADDLVQKTWLRALERPPRHGTSPDGWLATVMRNLARDDGKSERRRTAREHAAARPPTSPSTADVVARADAHQRVIRAVLALREPLRTTVLLRFFDDLPPRVIAERCGVPAATVRSRLHRALGELRGELERADPGGWQLALLPLAARADVGTATATPAALGKTVKGGLLVTTKKKLGIVAAVLLLGLLGAAPFLAGGAEPDAPPAPEGPAPVETATERSRQRPKPVAAAPDPETVPSAAEDEPTIQIEEPEPPRPERLEVRIVRELPAPAKPKPAASPKDRTTVEVDGAGAGGLTLVPGATRWAPVPLEGDASLAGKVTDSTGRAVADATILRVWLDARGDPVRWSRWIKFDRIGKTGPDGTFAVGDQPVGTFLIGADFHTVMRAGGDLSTEGAQRVTVKAGEARDGIHITLPFDTANFGVVEGAIMGSDGKPMPGRLVSFGRHGNYADRNGRFRIGGVEPGEYTVRVQASGHKPASKRITVAAGETVRADLALEFLEEGDLELVGRVVDRDGRAVVGSQVYFGTGMEDGRDTYTDANGVFRFPGLHARFEKDPVNLVVHPRGHDMSAHSSEWKHGVTVPQPGLEIVVDRFTDLHVQLRDAVSGDPLQLFAIKLFAVLVIDGKEERKQLRGMSVYREDGTIALGVPRGRIEMTVEAKDHVGVQVEVDVPDVDGPKEIVLELRPE